jgi:tetratricopeptide (TPR) repeat protein
MDETDWERRVDALWAAIDDHGEDDFRAAMERLVAERPPGDPVGLFELAAAYDSTGHPEPAAERYRAALDGGLTGYRRRRAVIQLASSLRNLGRVDESLALLEAERDSGFGELGDELAAFLALALTSAGREREAVAVALTALAPHLTRYTRSVTAYAADLA